MEWTNEQGVRLTMDEAFDQMRRAATAPARAAYTYTFGTGGPAPARSEKWSEGRVMRPAEVARFAAGVPADERTNPHGVDTVVGPLPAAGKPRWVTDTHGARASVMYVTSYSRLLPNYAIYRYDDGSLVVMQDG